MAVVPAPIGAVEAGPEPLKTAPLLASSLPMNVSRCLAPSRNEWERYHSKM